MPRNKAKRNVQQGGTHLQVRSAIEQNPSTRSSTSRRWNERQSNHTRARSTPQNKRPQPRSRQRSASEARAVDTDGDYNMAPARRGSPAWNGQRPRASLGKALLTQHAWKPSCHHCEKTTAKNITFRRTLLSLLERQRSVVEKWADTVGASELPEPMDWQPEVIVPVHIVRSWVECESYPPEKIAGNEPILGTRERGIVRKAAGGIAGAEYACSIS